MSILAYVCLALALGCVAGFAAMTGIGGGILYTPIQVLAGIDIHDAAAASLLLIIVMSLSASLTYHRAGKIDWVLVALFEAFTASGGFAGGYLSNLIPSGALMALLAATLTIFGIMLIRHEPRGRSPGDGDRRWFVLHRSFGGTCYAVNMLLAAPLLIAAGMLAGLVGIGGGVVKVPLMILIFGIPTDIAIATSACMVGITAMGGLAGHVTVGHGNWGVALVAAPAVLVGAQLGARTMLRISKGLVRRIFGAALILTAAAVLLKLFLLA